MLKNNLFFLFSITVFAIASTILSVFNNNPYQSTPEVFIVFYLSLFLALTGVLSIIIYYAKLKFHKNKNIYGFFWPSLRQSALFSLGVTILAVLKSLKILDWWVGGPLLIAVLLLEFFFQTVSPTRNKTPKNENI